MIGKCEVCKQQIRIHSLKMCMDCYGLWTKYRKKGIPYKLFLEYKSIKQQMKKISSEKIKIEWGRI